MDPTKLGYFVTVADEGHFGRAARRLYVTPSAVSVGIRALERSLGLELFDRTSRRVHLTDAGRALLPEARDLLHRHEQFRAAVRQQRNTRDSPVYTIGLHDEGLAELTPEVLTAIRTGLPDVELRVTAGLSYAQISTALASGLVDAMLAGESIATDEDDFVALYRDRRATHVHADSDEAAALSLSVSDVLDLPVMPLTPDVLRLGRPYYLMDERNGEAPNYYTGQFSNVQDYLLATALDGVVQHSNAAAGRFYPHPNVRYVPLTDAPPLAFGAVFPTADRTGLRRDVETIITSFTTDGHRRIPGALPPATSAPST